MERREAIAARAERRRQRRLDEWDFLLGVHDETRMGALRLEHADAYIAADSLGVPPSTRLRELESLAAEFEGGVSTGVSEEQRWVAMLIAPGSSLGGSRPKANFLDPAGALWLAKFPSRSDRSDVGAWEAVSATLARRAGIAVADFSLRRLANPYATFCTARFDRASDGRIAYASAMTAAQKRDGEEASYLDLAEAIENFVEPQSVAADLEQLFRRVVFNVRTANRDDHLRNHGFLRGARGWRLAPAFDVNPTPAKGEHALRLNDALGLPEMELVLETRHFYRLKESRAVDIVNEVDGAITGWRSVAESFGITREEIDRFGDLVFEAQQTR